MKKPIQINLIALTLLLAFFSSGVPLARAQGTAFSYQGRLSNSTGFANGVYDFTFTLDFLNSGGASAATPVTNNAVAVTNGLFTTTVDFGSAPFVNGINLWLDIAVRTNGTTTFTELTPRQPVTPTPYALVARSALNLTGSIPASQVSGTLAQAQLPANVALLNVRQTFTAINSFTGGVGIGTINPSRLLEIYDPNSSTAQLRLSEPSGNLGVEFVTTEGTRHNWRVGAQNLIDDGFEITPSTTSGGTSFSTPALAILGSGNVGIGTVNPQAALDVDGNINVEGALQTQNPGDYIGVFTRGNFDFRMDGEGFVSSRTFNLFDITTGTRQNMLTVGGNGSVALGYANNADAPYSTISGGQFNIVSGDYSTIGGGEDNFNESTNSVIAGGFENLIAPACVYSVIGGGSRNSISWPIPGVPVGPSYYATIAGGMNHTIDGTSIYGTISGGSGNSVSGGGSTAPVIAGGQGNIAADYPCPSIGGGLSNTVIGAYSTIPGGIFNYAAGYCSFAAGANAQALHDGAFVWADSGSPAGNGPIFSSTGANQFSVRCTGGARFVTGIGSFGNPTSGVKLNSGDNSWSSISDRNAKKNFEPVDTRAVLEKLAAIPVQTWNYKWEPDETVRNIGPMAQDFKAAFYPGRDDKSISTMEFDGVELAAIQGLNQKVEEKDAKIKELEARLEKLEQLLNAKNGEAK